MICEGVLNIAFVALRTNKPLFIKMELNGQFTIKTDDMDLAGLLVQSLISYLNLVDLQTTCDFPEELDSIQQLLVKVNTSSSVFSKCPFTKGSSCIDRAIEQRAAKPGFTDR